MNSVSRVGLTIAGLATTVMVAGVFVVQGFVAAQHEAAQTATPATPAAAVSPADTPTASPSPATVYINPVPSPSVINVIQTAPPVAAKRPPVIHVVVPTTGGDDDGGSDD